MADEEKEKAEKLAAAKKRFEQLKKEQKKSKKGSKKKEDKTTESKAEDDNAANAGEEAADDAPTAEAAAAADDDEEEEEPADASRPEATRKASIPQQSKQRSESFRHGTDGPQAEVQDLYRKQAGRIEQLEKENKALKESQEQDAARLSKAEEELESLREGSSDVAELKTKAKEADRLSAEVASLQRQLSSSSSSTQPQTPQSPTTISNANPSSTSPTSSRRISTADSTALLASKTSTIESLELETSNLRHQVTQLTTQLSTSQSALSSAESRSAAAEAHSTSLQAELSTLKSTTSSSPSSPPPPSSPSSIPDPSSASLSTATSRIASLESKLSTLTKLHREALLAKDQEILSLRPAPPHHRNSHVRDVSDFELGEDETETGRLQARIRALEAENFELKRGRWRERRAEMQPRMGGEGEDEEEGGGGEGYEEVDLNGPPPTGSLLYGRGEESRRSPLGRMGGGGRQTSTFSEVISSGINAFTNLGQGGGGQGGGQGQGGQQQQQQQHGRAQSLGLISDDGFDEDAWRLAQEEEAKRRIERVKEVKRGLEQWRGWRVDVVELRQRGGAAGRECGPVFEA